MANENLYFIFSILISEPLALLPSTTLLPNYFPFTEIEFQNSFTVFLFDKGCICLSVAAGAGSMLV